ncbi:MAG TPA: LytR C-terminal domain-containing protein [Bacteroidota bacterium]|nr:LytR C-terminal domain-containing protein [Bacteroidota bacterium]
MPDRNDSRTAAAGTGTAGRQTRRVLSMALNVAIVLTFLAIAYFSYTYIARSASAPAEAPQTKPAPAAKVIQLDVLNGCGARGAASRVTGVLRNAGFDVVEMKNYKVRTVEKTLVVDRVGNLAAARRVASALGVPESNIVQQINPDYFVDVSVILGADYAVLSSLRH